MISRLHIFSFRFLFAERRATTSALKIFFAILLVFVLVFGTIANAIVGGREPNFYYFNPDSIQSNLSRLKTEMDTFIGSAKSNLAFQPFAHLADFDQMVRSKKPAFLLLPHWYLLKYGGELKIKPFLRPLRKGSSTYVKVLVVRKDQNVDLNHLKNISLAMTSMGPDGSRELRNSLFTDKDLNLNEVNTIVVPKDSDAIFAVALGQVTMALVSKANLKRIAKINPRIMQAVKSIMESNPILLPQLCYVEGRATAEQIKLVKKLFLGPRKVQARKHITEMLQIDAWQEHK